MNIDWLSWIELALRWFHVIAGIAWIGSSFYFIWLDNSLRRGPGVEKGVAGDLWSVHGGGFYHQRKFTLAPPALPEELHWFKYEAYFTWISGFLLLILLYYLGAELYLIDPAKADLAPWQASGLGLGLLAAGWLAYDGLCRSPLARSERALGIVWFALLTAAAFALSQVFSGRGAYMHVGALIGTAMAANVFFVIIPNQKKAVAAMRRGNTPDPELGRAAKQRSLHNNYMTLPVVFIMVSSHYPATFSGAHGWAVLAGLSLAGVLIRHVFNLRHRGRGGWAYAAAGIVVFLASLLFAEAMRQRPAAGGAEVGLAEVEAIVERHCLACHASKPSHPAFAAPPGGLALETPGQILRNAALIREQTVMSHVMPLGNETGMTEAERAALGAWIERMEEAAANGR